MGAQVSGHRKHLAIGGTDIIISCYLVGLVFFNKMYRQT